MSQQELSLDRFTRLARAARLKAACHQIAEIRGFDAMATELDRTFSSEGRHVSTGLLHNTLADNERNYLRAEWIPVFLEYDDGDAIAQLCADVRGKILTPAKRLSPEDKLAILEERLVRELGDVGKRMVADVEGPITKGKR